jgi:hypothetical protein
VSFSSEQKGEVPLPKEKADALFVATTPAQPELAIPNAIEVAGNYAFNTGTTGSLTDMSAGTTQLVGANLDDTASAVQNNGFDFYFQGVRFSQFSANSNGLIRLALRQCRAARPQTAGAGRSVFDYSLRRGPAHVGHHRQSSFQGDRRRSQPDARR